MWSGSPTAEQQQQLQTLLFSDEHAARPVLVEKDEMPTIRI